MTTPNGHGHQHHDHTHDVSEHGGHSHNGGARGRAHHHAHRPGPFGWLGRAFGHSHSVIDRIDETMESNERGIWALKISLVGLGLTALLQVLIVALSGSVALLADTIHNFADAGTSVPLWIAFALTKRGTSRRFTYGYGKTEDVAGVAVVLIIFFRRVWRPGSRCEE